MAKDYFPSGSQIEQAMNIAQWSVEGAEYFASQMAQFIDESAIMKRNPAARNMVLHQVEQFVRDVKENNQIGLSVWAGRFDTIENQELVAQDMVAIARAVNESAAAKEVLVDRETTIKKEEIETEELQDKPNAAD